MMERVNIQVQSPQGVWRTIATSYNEPQRLRKHMEAAGQAYHEYRVRVTDMEGRVVDIL